MNTTTRFISDILFDKEIDLVLFPAKNNDKFWDSFVKIGSSHYVIPALYYKLKERDYIKLLNDELVSYLEEIYSQNLKRNLELVKEVNEISKLFKSNNIDHVFLKGAALISSLYKKSIGIRMVGDIDILIAKDQLFKAKEILKKNGYYNPNKYDGLKGRHLPRIINHNKVFALELHSTLLHDDSIYLKRNNLLKNKIVQKINILNWDDFLLHIILNYQVNDHGSLKANFSFRTLLDTYNLIKFNPEIEKRIIKSIHVDKIKLIMNKLQILNYQHNSKLWVFNFRLKFRTYSAFYSNFENKIVHLLIMINLNFQRIIAFIKFREYRSHVLNKLGFIK